MPLSNNKEAHMSLSSGFVIFVLFVGFILFILLGCALGLIIPKIPSIAKKKKEENVQKRKLSPEELETAAYHEAGHAVVCHFLLKNVQVDNVKIFPTVKFDGSTGSAGETRNLRLEFTDDTKEMKNSIACDLGGYVAEELKFGTHYPGASDDLFHASAKARNMVLLFGMSDVIGPISFMEYDDASQTGKINILMYGNDIANKASCEIQKILNDAEERAKDVLIKNKDILEQIAQELIEKYELGEEELSLIFSRINL